MRYQLVPPEELRAARDAFPHYEICQFHDPAGLPEVTAVLKPSYRHSDLAVLVCAATVTELAEILSAQPRPGLPRRDPHRRYWRYPRP
ncbi:hypothetical protein [Thermobifida cellulosilytica]|uniref:Uncharacterized protein n=1 Tax=Thermobifida cellulosilytica TB100 TaxID=665004 RepID=A0A147KKM1_THECS|nr:hypothetical protein [Thermobifida cellulosilytica]KUP97771.1 hypothetical protein AC529_04790 [Thermobifida cellulosilytica TB100]